MLFKCQLLLLISSCCQQHYQIVSSQLQVRKCSFMFLFRREISIKLEREREREHRGERATNERTKKKNCQAQGNLIRNQQLLVHLEARSSIWNKVLLLLLFAAFIFYYDDNEDGDGDQIDNKISKSKFSLIISL